MSDDAPKPDDDKKHPDAAEERDATETDARPRAEGRDEEATAEDEPVETRPEDGDEDAGAKDVRAPARAGEGADVEAEEAEAARPGPGPAPEPAGPAHPLARKRLWLGLSALILLSAGATTIAAPLFAGEAASGWMAAALSVAGAALLFESFSVPRWKGGVWRIVQGMALAYGGVVMAFSPSLGGLPTLAVAGGATAVFGAAGLLCGLWSIGMRGWPMPLIGGLAGAGAGAGVFLLDPPPMPDLPVFLIGGALIVAGFTTSGLAAAARKA